jgi:ketoreductase RED2
MRAKVLAEAPLERLGLPADIADAVLGMVRSRYVTGQVVYADGGLMVH